MPAHTKLNGVLHGTSCSLQCVQMHCILPSSQCFLTTELPSQEGPLGDAIPQNMLWKPCFVRKKVTNAEEDGSNDGLWSPWLPYQDDRLLFPCKVTHILKGEEPNGWKTDFGGA